MDAVSDPKVQRVVIMSSAQVGKTEMLNNIVGFHIDQDAAPILVLQPTLEMAETWSKDRLTPMLRDTPSLRDKVADPRTRDSGNTLLHKRFAGGHITVVGANSAAGLASRPIRVVLADEVDRYPASAGTEGDPLSLAVKRTATFWNRRIVVVSTPTIKGFSRIESEWMKSDQRRYFVPCSHCGFEQHLVWRQVKWPDGKPDQASYFCEDCGVSWTDADRRHAVKRGRWVSTSEEESTIIGFHLNELYSPWSTPASIAMAFLEAKGNPETLKTWVNTSLGETWESDAERVDPNSLMARAKDWGESAPIDVMVATMSVDVQADRLEALVVGWGVGEQSWILRHRVLYGDPASQQVWSELEDLINTPVNRIDEAMIPIRICLIDSGAFTSFVYDFCKNKFPKIRAIKGTDHGPVWPQRASKNNPGRVNLFMIGTVAAKDAVYARLKITESGPGCINFPKGLDAAFYDQLTAEQVETKYLRGFPKRVYTLQSGRRNEALDLMAYSIAAIKALNVRWGDISRGDVARGAKISMSNTDRAQSQIEPESPEKIDYKRERSRDGWLGTARNKRGGWI